MVEARVSEFVCAVDQMIRAHDAWSSDEQQPSNIPPQSLLDACETLFGVAHKASVAGRERKLLASAEKFEVVCHEFTGGMAMKRNGEPQDRFYTALRELMHERNVLGDLVVRRPESVATLRRQKVSDFQIAQHIYGRRGKGPFIDADGRIMHELIDKEEKEPGSVVPADWIPEAEIERLRDQHIAIGEAAQPNGRTTKGRPTVEGMLREGADIMEICAACGVTEKQVKAIAKALDIEIPAETRQQAE